MVELLSHSHLKQDKGPYLCFSVRGHKPALYWFGTELYNLIFFFNVKSSVKKVASYLSLRKKHKMETLK